MPTTIAYSRSIPFTGKATLVSFAMEAFSQNQIAPGPHRP